MALVLRRARGFASKVPILYVASGDDLSSPVLI